MTRIAGIGGGIGASRLWRALADAVAPADLALVVNTADDLWIHGLRVCPDLDTTLYALSGRQDFERGWGVRDETWRVSQSLASLGHDVWFNLGDQDLATSLYRTGRLREGVGLATITAALAAVLGVGVRVLPMTEAEVATTVQVAGELMHYQEFIIRHHAEPAVERVTYEGSADATAGPGVLAALDEAELIIVAPSNPIASVEPILALPGVRELLRRRTEHIVAVSPIVAGVPIDDPGERGRARSRAALLAARDLSADAPAVAALYQDFCRRFILDSADGDRAGEIRGLGIEPVVVDTMLHRGADPAALLRALLETRAAARISPGPGLG